MAPAASSSAFSAIRASPPERAASARSASGSTSTRISPRPRSGSDAARTSRSASCSSVRAFSLNTLERDSSGEFTSKDGFSVVAPIRMTVPFSTWGRITSCCALLNLCISSMNSIVRCRCMPSRSPASLTTLRSSATPEPTALTGLKWPRLTDAISRASVVLPVPGGPQSTMDGMRSASMLLRSARPGPTRCSCPTSSSKVRGRIRVASGACRSISDCASCSKSVTARRSGSLPYSPARQSRTTASSASSCSWSTVRGSSTTASSSMRATTGGEPRRSRDARPVASPLSSRSSDVGSVSPGRLPPPMADCPPTTDAPSPREAAQPAARSRRASTGSAIMRQVGISSTASPFT